MDDKMVFELHAEVCKSLANPKRLEILALLCKEERNVDDLAQRMGIPKANVSQHLAVLREKGIVATRREGLHVFYRVANPKILQACQLMREVAFDQLKRSGRLARLFEEEE